MAGLILVMVGCSPALNEDVLPLEPPETFSAKGDEQAPDRWWTSFEDPRLNVMVDSALSANFNLKSVWQQLKVAQAVADRESSFILPDVEGFMQGGVRLPPARFCGR
ncbi:MAG: hypothetical protein U5L96_14860 [Owenweeksia sp.]|nr:hypothetical protein [Owenweeksia sp.]